MMANTPADMSVMFRLTMTMESTIVWSLSEVPTIVLALKKSNINWCLDKFSPPEIRTLSGLIFEKILKAASQ